jgi:signal transduction histidine kinase
VTSIAELQQLVHPDDRARLAEEMRAAVSGQAESYQVEHRVKNRAGEWLWIASRAKVVRRNAEGQALRVTGTNADISQRKQIDKMKDEFIGIVSHELRTPLTAILGALGLLSAKDAPDGQDAKMLLDMAYQNSERLTALVNDVLDIEKLEAGMMDMQIAPTALGPFLLRAVELNRSYADRFTVRYELRGPIPAVSMNVDAERLMQVMTNLLSNATKFSPTGGTVTIGAQVQGKRVRVSVSDTGPGIPAEFRDRVFQKFAQADASSTRRKGGTGLGLWICQAIIEKLDGRIAYESEPGNGATFYFDLPLTTT